MSNLRAFRAFLLVLLFVDIRPHAAAAAAAGDRVFDILYFGAEPGGGADSSKALLDAWRAACESPVPATVHVPPGTFLISKAAMSGPCKNGETTMRIDGTLVAPLGYSDAAAWISFDRVTGLTVTGGTIDGRGASLWECKARQPRQGCPFGTTSLQVTNSAAVVIGGLTSLNSKLYHIVVNNCRNVVVRGVRVSAPGDSPNTDGIHVQGSADVAITGTDIGTGDDCISVGPGTTNLWIERVACGPGHGISIGSLGKQYEEAGVRNVTVKTTVFRDTQNGLRIKTWGRPSRGFVRGVLFAHVLMLGVQNPIIIDQNYCPGNVGCPGQDSGVKISEVTYSDIRGSSATPVAVELRCSPATPCTGIGLEDIRLTYGAGRAAAASCDNAGGSSSGVVIPPGCL